MKKPMVLSFSVYLYVAPLASHTMSDATMLEGSNMGFSFTDLRPFNRDISHEISLRAVGSVCENGNAVASFRENGDDMIAPVICCSTNARVHVCEHTISRAAAAT